MADAGTLLELARGEIGVTESPAGSNRVKYNTAYYGREVSGDAYPWCAAFQWWLFQQAGAGELFYGGGKTASCTTLYHDYRSRGQVVETVRAQPGDLVFFVFDGNTKGVMNHIGICESAGGGYVTTIDGNTGTTSETDGGTVMRRRRALQYVGGVARPNYTIETEDDDMLTQEQFNAMAYAFLAELAEKEPDAWSREAREWAEGKGVIKGDENGRKQYKSFCTREQMVVFLQRVAEKG